MPTEETGSGVRGFVRGLFAETRGAAQKTIAKFIVTTVVAVLAVLALQVKGSAFSQGAIIGAVGTVLLWFTVLGLIGLWRYLRRKPPAPPPVPDLAPDESTGRLAEAHLICARAFGYAHEYLEVDVCQAATTAEQRMICELVRQHVLTPFYRESELLSIRIRSFPTKKPTREEFGVIVEQYWTVLNTLYPGALAWIVNAGELIYGVDFRNSEGYAQLYQRHGALVQEVQRFKAWPSLLGLASWQQNLAQALLPPTRPADPGPPTASEQSPPPSPESSGFPGAST